MSRRRRPRLLLLLQPARPGHDPVRASPGCSKGPVRRGADRKEARQEDELPLRVRASVRPRSVDPCVRVCVCVSVRCRRSPPPSLSL